MAQGLPLTGRVYIWSVVAAAVGLLGYWLQSWQAPLPDGSTISLVMLFVVLGAVATHFPLRIAPRHDVDVSTSVFFATLLLFGVPVAMLVGCASRLLGEVTLGIRRHLLEGRPMRSLRNILFNAGQWMLAIGVAGLVYYAFLPQEVPAALARYENLLAVPAAAAAMYLTNTLAVAIVISIQLGISVSEVWLLGRRRDSLSEAGLFLLGLVAARTAPTDAWIPLVMALPAAIIYLSTKRNVQLVEQTISAVETLADIVDQRDQYTFQHSKRVADYSQRIARAMRLPADEVEKIRLAARVHDLGKIGVPNEVLHKQGTLTDDEWQVMRRHPEMGYEILAKFPEYREGRELVLAHHERYDGKGYPNGLDGDHMRLGAQIIAVADTLDAMTSDRPYRKALPMETALAELHRGRGTQFNPLVVDTLARLLAQDAQKQAPRFVPSAVPAA